MDQLDALVGPATDLLRRVDAALNAHGAPTEHRLWPLLLRVGALTLPAAEAIWSLRAGPLLAAGSTLRQIGRDYVEARAAISRPPGWEGAGAQSFEHYRAGLAEHLAGGEASLAGHLHATADYTAALDRWITSSRTVLASVLAAALASAEAVTLIADTAAEIALASAAADIAAEVLAVIADIIDAGETLCGDWSTRLAEIGYREPDGEPPLTPPGTGVLHTRY